MSGRRPAYRGPKSYGLEDRDLFFGRGAQGRVVAGMIASEPISVLTGGSGTGKSSLLRAEIVPTLIGRGWCAVYAHPQSDPVESLTSELIAQVIAVPSEEKRVLELALGEAGDALSPRSRLSDLAKWYRRLPSDSSARTSILSPLADAKVPHIGLVARILTELIRVPQAVTQLSDMAAYGGPRAERCPEDPTLKEFLGLLDEADRGRPRLVQLLRRDSLARQAEAIWAGWAQSLGCNGVVLILDQAEELYTSFGGPGSIGDAHGDRSKYPWATRERLFDELADFARSAETKPLRFCFSLRPEHYADLRQSLDIIAPEERLGVYFLRRFNREQAAEAVTGPAERLKGRVQKRALDQALKELALEGELNEIDPFLLAVVFDLAWREAAKRDGNVRISLEDLAVIRRGPSPETVPTDSPRAPGDALADEHSRSLADGAMRWLLKAPFQDLAPGEDHDMLDLLRGLFSDEGTRRPVPEEVLVNRPLRDPESFRRLLERLEAEGLIRRFKRERTVFVDIRHERLSEPILARAQEVYEADRKQGGSTGRHGYRSFLKDALIHVASYPGVTLDHRIARGLEEDPLPDWAREALRRNFDAVAWDAPAAKLLLASLIHAGPARCDPPAEAETAPSAEEGESTLTSTSANVDSAAELLEDWEHWRSMVRQLLPLVGQRLSVPVVAARKTPDPSLEPTWNLVFRGARLDGDSASAWLRRLNMVPPAIWPGLWISKLTAPDSTLGRCRKGR